MKPELLIKPQLFVDPKQKDSSTVIILNKTNQGAKKLQINTKYLNSLLHSYIWGVLAVIVLLSGVIIYLRISYRRQEEEKIKLRSQISELQQQLPVQSTGDVKKGDRAQAYIQGIEGKLKKINDYLRKRGVKGFSNNSVGGNGNAAAAELSDEDAYSLYDDYLDRMLHTVAFTPMGYPRVSSINSFFGYRSDPFNSAHAEFHPGIDFKADKGDEARCTADGTVVFAGRLGGYGNCVRIAHANSFETLYGHLSRITVKVGQDVIAGQKVGEVGSTGRSTGPHLHYEIRQNGKAINPVNFLNVN
jgi:murein DD-endopeptidase MepM/ murein hydrolase activator NlpD